MRITTGTQRPALTHQCERCLLALTIPARPILTTPDGDTLRFICPTCETPHEHDISHLPRRDVRFLIDTLPTDNTPTDE